MLKLGGVRDALFVLPSGYVFKGAGKGNPIPPASQPVRAVSPHIQQAVVPLWLSNLLVSHSGSKPTEMQLQEIEDRCLLEPSVAWFSLFLSLSPLLPLSAFTFF